MAKRILVVDDIGLNRIYVMGKLQERGYETLEARDGREGYEKTMSENPDGIVTDLNMSKVPGSIMVENLRKQGYKGPIVMLTSYASNPDVYRRVLEMGVDECLDRTESLDRLVDIFDIVVAADAYGTFEGDLGYNPEADVAPMCGKVDIYDIVTVASKYGESCP